MDDLIAFVSARLDEDERHARAATPGPWRIPEHDPLACCVDSPDGSGRICRFGDRSCGDDVHNSLHIARHDPARVLREVAAKRAIVGLHAVHAEPERWGGSHRDPAMRGQPTGRTSYWCAICDDDRDYGHIGGPQEGCETLRLLAAVWSDHPDYRPDWKP